MDMHVPGERGGLGLRVLLLEREASAREPLRALLEGAGFEVQACEDVEAALEQIRGGPPDAVLASFPGGEVSHLCASLRAKRQPLLPILFLANAWQAESHYEAIAAGADEFLLKPVDGALLEAAIRARVQRARLLPAPSGAAPDTELRGGQLRRGEFLAQLGAVLHGGSGQWQVLMALRLDQGKALSEQLGHAASFELEQAVATRFAPALRPDDAYTLWMEFGFGLLVERDSREQIEALASELCARVAAAPFQVHGEERALTISVGIALPPAGADAGDADRWFASAYAAEAIAHRTGNGYDGVLSREYDMPPERVLIIREWAKEALGGGNVLVEFQPLLPLRPGLPGMYALDAKLRDYRAPLAGVRRAQYLKLARDAGSLPMIERMGLFNAFEAIDEERANGRATRVLVPVDLECTRREQLAWLEAQLRRRRGQGEGLVLQFDADEVLADAAAREVLSRLASQGVQVAFADGVVEAARLRALQAFPAKLLRLPLAAIETLEAQEFSRLLAAWGGSGRGIVASGLPGTAKVAQLQQLNVDYIQGDALAAGGPRLDYPFDLGAA